MYMRKASTRQRLNSSGCTHHQEGRCFFFVSKRETGSGISIHSKLPPKIGGLPKPRYWPSKKGAAARTWVVPVQGKQSAQRWPQSPHSGLMPPARQEIGSRAKQKSWKESLLVGGLFLCEAGSMHPSGETALLSLHHPRLSVHPPCTQPPLASSPASAPGTDPRHAGASSSLTAHKQM